jgi:hypothetical protein
MFIFNFILFIKMVFYNISLLYMVNALLGGQTMLKEFNKRGVGEEDKEDFVGGHVGESIYAEPLNFTFSPGSDKATIKNFTTCNKRTLCNNGDLLLKREDSVTYKGSAAYNINQKKINNQVGVDASRRLSRLKIKQNLINNDCPSTSLANSGALPSGSKFNNKSCTVGLRFYCSSCNYGYKQNDWKPHTRKNISYERYYLKRGRTMFTDEERAACNMKCKCDTDLNWRSYNYK